MRKVLVLVAALVVGAVNYWITVFAMALVANELQASFDWNPSKHVPQLELVMLLFLPTAAAMLTALLVTYLFWNKRPGAGAPKISN